MVWKDTQNSEKRNNVCLKTHKITKACKSRKTEFGLGLLE